MVNYMYLKVMDQKIKIIELTKFWDKFKSLKFVLEPIDYGIKISNKRCISTYFFCQSVDIIFTDKNDTIKYIYKDVISERNIIKIKKYNIYLLPLNIGKHFNIGDKLKIKSS